MKEIPDSHQDLLTDVARSLAYLATLMPDGTPQLTPLWFTARDGYIIINTARGRIKDRNMSARPNVAVVIQDRNDDNRYIQVRGRVVEIDEASGLAVIDELAMKYRGKHWTPTPGQTRVTYKILPEHATVYT